MNRTHNRNKGPRIATAVVVIWFALFTGFLLPSLTAQNLEGSLSKINKKELRSGYKTIGKDGRVPFLLDLEIASDWHIQANELEDETLINTELTVVKPEGARIVKKHFPDGHKFSSPQLGTTQVYSDSIEAAVLVELPRDFSGEKAEISLKLTVQACSDNLCLPPEDWTRDFSIAVTGAEPEKNSAVYERAKKLLGDLKTTEKEGDRNKSTDDKKQDQGQTDSGDGEEKSEVSAPAEPERPPEEVVKSLGLNIESSGESKYTKILQEKGFFYALLFAFLSGLVGSLSPCVYPMIPLTLSYFGSQAESSEGEENTSSRLNVVFLALIYVLGICITFSVLGVLAALIGIPMGVALGSPFFVGFLVLLFLLMAFSMMGMFEIPVPSSLQGMAGSKPGMTGAFFMGILLGVIAIPCVGPIAAAILAFIAGTGNIFFGFVSMFVFGLGIGILFLGLAIFGGSFTSMSTGGSWLKNIKIFWGFVLIGVDIYFFDLFLGLINATATANWLIPLSLGTLGLVFGMWLFSLSPLYKKDGNEIHLGGVTGRSFGILMLILGSYFALGSVARSGLFFPVPSWWQYQEEEEQKIKWEKSLIQGVKKAKKEGKPIFIDFYADWCLPCKSMDRNVFSDEKVARYVNQHFVAIKLDCTDTSGWNMHLKERVFKAKGMPFYAFFDSGMNYMPEFSLSGKESKDKFLEQLRDVIKEEKKRSGGVTLLGKAKKRVQKR